MKFDLQKFEDKVLELKQIQINNLIISGLWPDQHKGHGYIIQDTPTYKYLEHNLITDSAMMIREFTRAAVIQAYTFIDKPCVLIRGESGTGKETFARSFAQPGLPFVGINCTALPEYLLESELFGHVQGAFTGAIRDKDGLIKIADNGVLFLDEIGDMPESLQPKLLRVIQDRKFRPVGSNMEYPVKCRIVCATHRNETHFRKDLYTRVSQYVINILPLKYRKDDAFLYLQKRYPDIEFVPADVYAVIDNGNYRDLDNFAREWQLAKWML